MPDQIPPPAPDAPPPATPAAVPADLRLPESVIAAQPPKPPSADEMFAKHKAANPDPAAAPAPAPAGSQPPAPPASPAPAAAAKGSLADKLMKKPDAPAAPPASAPDTKPDFLAQLDGAPPPDASKKGSVAEHFAHWKGEAKTFIGGLQKQVADLQTQLAEAKKAPAAASLPPEFEKLKAEHKEMSDRLLVLDVQHHPTFRTQFTEPKQAALQQAQQLLTDGGVSGVDVTALLAMPRASFGKAVSEAAAKLSTFDQADFAAQMRSAYNLAQQEGQAMAKSRETLDALRTQTGARAQQAFEAVRSELTSKVGEFMPTVEIPDGATADVKTEIETYNAAVAYLPEAAKKIAFEATDERSIAKSAFKAAAYDFHIQHALPKLLREHQAVIENNARLSKEIAEIRARNPNRNIHAPGGGDNGTTDMSKMDHATAARYIATGVKG